MAGRSFGRKRNYGLTVTVSSKPWCTPNPMVGCSPINLPSDLSRSDDWDDFSSQRGAWVARD
jgi:hypothetical protein